MKKMMKNGYTFLVWKQRLAPTDNFPSGFFVRQIWLKLGLFTRLLRSSNWKHFCPHHNSCLLVFIKSTISLEDRLEDLLACGTQTTAKLEWHFPSAASKHFNHVHSSTSNCIQCPLGLFWCKLSGKCCLTEDLVDHNGLKINIPGCFHQAMGALDDFAMNVMFLDFLGSSSLVADCPWLKNVFDGGMVYPLRNRNSSSFQTLCTIISKSRESRIFFHWHWPRDDWLCTVHDRNIFFACFCKL